jgi:hypothetical protein
MRIIKWFIWVLRGKPTITYPGYNCGCCGKWWDETYRVPHYELKESIIIKKGDSLKNEVWGDTWGLCHKGKGCNI